MTWYRAGAFVPYARDSFAFNGKVGSAAADYLATMACVVADADHFSHVHSLFQCRFLVVFRIDHGNRGVLEYVTSYRMLLILAFLV